MAGFDDLARRRQIAAAAPGEEVGIDALHAVFGVQDPLGQETGARHGTPIVPSSRLELQRGQTTVTGRFEVQIDDIEAAHLLEELHRRGIARVDLDQVRNAGREDEVQTVEPAQAEPPRER